MSEEARGSVATSFTAERRFRVWRYTVSHMTLLLRSAAWHEGEDTVDVWFDGVSAMNLHESFRPLTIRVADIDERARIFTHAAGGIFDQMDRPRLCLILASDQPDGFIVCAHARVTAHTRGPGVVGPPKDFDPDNARLLWSAGPTGERTPRHRHTLHEAGRAFLRAQTGQAGPDEQAHSSL